MIPYLKCAHIIIFVIFALIGQNGFGQSRTFSFLVEQDLFFYNKETNEDRNYTQGTLFALNDSRLRRSWMFYPFRQYQSFFKKNIRTPINSGISLFGTAFTPLIIDNEDPIIGDRPFAFLLGTSFSQLFILPKQNQYEVLTLNFGLFGTNIGYNFQSFAHKNLIQGRPTDPKGWNTQISKGGRFTMLGSYERIFVFGAKPKIQSGYGLDGNVTLGGSLGYYNRLFSSFYLRFGFLNGASGLNWSRFGKQLSSANFKDKNNCSTDFVEFFGFINLTYSYMGRNSFLEGQLWNSSYEYVLEKNWIINNIIEFDFGIGVGFNWSKNGKDKFINILYKNTIRSPEFDSEIFDKRSHYFGALGIQFPI